MKPSATAFSGYLVQTQYQKGCKGESLNIGFQLNFCFLSSATGGSFKYVSNGVISANGEFTVNEQDYLNAACSGSPLIVHAYILSKICSNSTEFNLLSKAPSSVSTTGTLVTTTFSSNTCSGDFLSETGVVLGNCVEDTFYGGAVTSVISNVTSYSITLTEKVFSSTTCSSSPYFFLSYSQSTACANGTVTAFQAQTPAPTGIGFLTYTEYASPTCAQSSYLSEGGQALGVCQSSSPGVYTICGTSASTTPATSEYFSCVQYTDSACASSNAISFHTYLLPLTCAAARDASNTSVVVVYGHASSAPAADPQYSKGFVATTFYNSSNCNSRSVVSYNGTAVGTCRKLKSNIVINGVIFTYVTSTIQSVNAVTLNGTTVQNSFFADPDCASLSSYQAAPVPSTCRLENYTYPSYYYYSYYSISVELSFSTAFLPTPAAGPAGMLTENFLQSSATFNPAAPAAHACENYVAFAQTSYALDTCLFNAGGYITVSLPDQSLSSPSSAAGDLLVVTVFNGAQCAFPYYIAAYAYDSACAASAVPSGTQGTSATFTRSLPPLTSTALGSIVEVSNFNNASACAGPPTKVSRTSASFCTATALSTGSASHTTTCSSDSSFLRTNFFSSDCTFELNSATIGGTCVPPNENFYYYYYDAYSYTYAHPNTSSNNVSNTAFACVNLPPPPGPTSPASIAAAVSTTVVVGIAVAAAVLVAALAVLAFVWRRARGRASAPTVSAGAVTELGYLPTSAGTGKFADVATAAEYADNAAAAAVYVVGTPVHGHGNRKRDLELQ